MIPDNLSPAENGIGMEMVAVTSRKPDGWLINGVEAILDSNYVTRWTRNVRMCVPG